MRWRARSSSDRQAGTTSTNRNSAALSSASWAARSIALLSNAFSGLRVTGIARASRAPTSCSSASKARSSTMSWDDTSGSSRPRIDFDIRSQMPLCREPTLVSVAAPMHDEEGTVEAFHARVRAALEHVPFELVIVDDGSRDGTAAELAEPRRRRPARQGRHALAQLRPPGGADRRRSSTPRGDVVVMLDGDLQDPPEVIPEMLDRWRDGADVVYAVRSERRGETAFKRTTASWFYRLFRSLADIDLTPESGDFRLMDRRPLDALLAMPERNRFLRGMSVWVGFTQTAVTFEREARAAGRTKYTLRRMVRFSLRRDHELLAPPAAVRDAARVRVLGARLPRDPADDRRSLHEHLRPRRAVGDRDHPAARRHPADLRRDHRRVRGPHLRRGQAPAAVRGARQDEPRAREGRRDRRGRRPGSSPRTGSPQAGHEVDVYERWPGLGGQAATLDVGGGHRLERYYHHLFTTDRHIAALYDELGMPDELEWRPSSVAMFAHGRQWPFTTPARPAALRPAAAARRACAWAPPCVALQRLRTTGRRSSGVTARAWIERWMGRAAWREVWGPMLRGKFGARADEIAMVWLWSKLRLRRGEDAREEQLGYPRRSWEPLFAALRDVDRERRRARADRPPGGADRAGPRGDVRRARLVPRRPRPARLRAAPAPSATTACSPPCRTTSSRG